MPTNVWIPEKFSWMCKWINFSNFKVPAKTNLVVRNFVGILRKYVVSLQDKYLPLQNKNYFNQNKVLTQVNVTIKKYFDEWLDNRELIFLATGGTNVS